MGCLVTLDFFLDFQVSRAPWSLYHLKLLNDEINYDCTIYIILVSYPFASNPLKLVSGVIIPDFLYFLMQLECISNVFKEFEIAKYYICIELRILRVIFVQTHRAQTRFLSSEATFN